MKLLIVNADDLGLSDAINEAVKAGYLSGAVTGVSILACGKCFPGAVRMLRDIGKPEVGAHLALTGRFAPCTKEQARVRTLTDGAGRLRSGYRAFMGPYFLGRIGPDEIRLELSNQIKLIRAEGLTITHLDSHEHVHMLPGILDIVLGLAEEFGIPYIRLPRETISVTGKDFSAAALARYCALRVFTAGSGKLIRAAGIRCNDAFLGHFHSGRINDDVLCHMLDHLGDGVSELAVHPGLRSGELAEESPWHKNAQNELDTLLEGSWRGRADKSGIRLVSHREVIEERKGDGS